MTNPFAPSNSVDLDGVEWRDTPIGRARVLREGLLADGQHSRCWIQLVATDGDERVLTNVVHGGFVADTFVAHTAGRVAVQHSPIESARMVLEVLETERGERVQTVDLHAALASLMDGDEPQLYEYAPLGLSFQSEGGLVAELDDGRSLLVDLTSGVVTVHTSA